MPKYLVQFIVTRHEREVYYGVQADTADQAVDMARRVDLPKKVYESNIIDRTLHGIYEDPYKTGDRTHPIENLDDSRQVYYGRGNTADVVIVIVGGIVSSVYAADPNIRALVVDYDHLGEVEAEATLVEPLGDMDDETHRLVRAF